MVHLDNQKSFTLEFSPIKNFVKSATTIFSYNQKDLIRRPLVWLTNILPLNHLVAHIERIFKMGMILAPPVLSDSRNLRVVSSFFIYQYFIAERVQIKRRKEGIALAY